MSADRWRDSWLDTKVTHNVMSGACSYAKGSLVCVDLNYVNGSADALFDLSIAEAESLRDLLNYAINDAKENSA